MSLVKTLIYWFIMKLLKAKQLSTGYTPLAMVFIILQKSKHFLTLLSIHFCSAHVIFVTLFFRILLTLVAWFCLFFKFLFCLSCLAKWVSKQALKMILVILDNQNTKNEVTKICNEPCIQNPIWGMERHIFTYLN